jgi:hypothetical protein
MEYNKGLPQIKLPEYGRNIHKMVDYAINVEDKETRNKVAQAIIDVMGQLNPHLRDVNDFKHKLWDHLFIISDFKLDVDSPYPRPSKETFETKPDRVNYPTNNIRYKHYGKVCEDLIQKAIEMEEGEMKEALVESIANLMKRSYVNWNKDSVSDEVIFDHLGKLSAGKLMVKENTKLFTNEFSNTRNFQQVTNNPKKKKQHNNKHNTGHKKKF